MDSSYSFIKVSQGNFSFSFMTTQVKLIFTYNRILSIFNKGDLIMIHKLSTNFLTDLILKCKSVLEVAHIISFQIIKKITFTDEENSPFFAAETV